MQQHLEDLRAREPAVEAAAVLGADGQPLAWAGADEASVAVLCSMVTALHGVADRSSAELGLGAMRSLLVHGAAGFLAVHALDDRRFLVATTGRRAASGAVLGALRATAARLAAPGRAA